MVVLLFGCLVIPTKIGLKCIFHEKFRIFTPFSLKITPSGWESASKFAFRSAILNQAG